MPLVHPRPAPDEPDRRNNGAGAHKQPAQELGHETRAHARGRAEGIVPSEPKPQRTERHKEEPAQNILVGLKNWLNPPST